MATRQHSFNHEDFKSDTIDLLAEPACEGSGEGLRRPHTNLYLLNHESRGQKTKLEGCFPGKIDANPENRRPSGCGDRQAFS